MEKTVTSGFSSQDTSRIYSCRSCNQVGRIRTFSPSAPLYSTQPRQLNRENLNRKKTVRAKQVNKKEGKKSNTSNNILNQMVGHDLLSKEEEKVLSAAVRAGQSLRDEIKEIIEQKQYSEVRDSNYSNLKDSDKVYEQIKSKRPKRKTRSKTTVLDAAELYGPEAKAEELLLTEDDIVNKLNLAGGKEELSMLLNNASRARKQFIACNLRLVISISRKMYKKQTDASKIQPYGFEATWNLPSLDEVVQEGILGLSRAVDKYDPSFGYKFSTYASYWITSHVQNAFRSASTGALAVPMNVSVLRTKYNKLVKEHIEMYNNQTLCDKVIAKQLGVTVERLNVILSATQTLSSLDVPVSSDNGVKPDSSRTILDNLPGPEFEHPENYVELSMLRQRLENAMASKLSNFERDIVRLRLGLDGHGKKRTVREVMILCGRPDLSMNDIRSTERKAYYKLRKPASLISHGLNAYSDWNDIFT